VTAGPTIALARPRDLAAIPAIELAAATLLRGHAPDAVLAETTSDDALRAAHGAGRLWVALVDDAPVGFALVEMLGPDQPHLEEVDVDPRWGRRGLGRALVQAACDWAVRAGHPAITLTTFRGVRWNMPFYASLGFDEVAGAEIGPALAAIVRDEASRGLDPAARVVMRWRPRRC
jgi:GNAT superfamily N-acetyltransferase